MENPKGFPLCEKEVQSINFKFTERGWITLYEKDRIFSALVNDTQLERAMMHDAWDLAYFQTAPWVNDPGNSNILVRYHEEGVEPIVLIQEPKGMHFEEVAFLCEEFVMFYDLRHIGNKYVQVDECGEDQDVAVYKDGSLIVSVKYLKEFIELKKMNLLVFIDTVQHSPKSLQQLGQKSAIPLTYHNDTDYIFSYSLQDSRSFCTNRCTAACFRGKVAFRHNPDDIRQLWDYHDERFVDYIVDVDSEGDEVLRTCDESQLSWDNFYPETLTPVYFKKSVLDRFYNSPNQYEVHDGFVCDTTQWLLRLDNDRNDDYVVATLVDLGRLPYKEQKYWREYNVQPPVDGKWSSTTFTRWFLGEARNASTSPALIFKDAYNQINKAWTIKYNWPLFLPLATKDQHHYSAIHSMAVDENDKEYDSLILSIVRLIIDSLNEGKILKAIDDTKPSVLNLLKEKGVQDEKKSNIKGGISKFELFMASKDISMPEFIKFLRNIQELRSTTAAHRKSRTPDKKALELFAYFRLTEGTEKESIDWILTSAKMYFVGLSKALGLGIDTEE